MRTIAAAILLLVTTACGGARGPFPEAGDGPAAIASAERLIADAQRQGGDSLASEVLGSARTRLSAAREALQSGQDDRAALLGRQATADARFAMASIRRAKAMSERAAAQASLNALPGGTP